MRLKASPSKRPPVENTIPLINVVFLMLIFFLIMGTVSTPLSSNVNPAITSLLPLVPPHQNVVEIDKDGQIFFRKQALSLTALVEILPQSSAHEKGSAEVVKLAADKKLQVDRLIEILDKLKSAGIRNVRLITVNGEVSQ